MNKIFNTIGRYAIYLASLLAIIGLTSLESKAQSASITVDNNPVCVGSAATFSATMSSGSTAIKYDWYLNGVYQGSSGATYTNSTLNGGDNVYCVILAVTGSTPGIYQSNTIIMSTSSVATTITASPNPACQNSTVTISVPSAGTGATYNWTGNSIVGGSTTNTMTATPNASGTQTYGVTITNSFGCTGTASVDILVNTQPTVVITASAPAICAGGSTTLSATGASQYSWYEQGSTTSIGTGATLTVLPSGNTTYYALGTETANGTACQSLPASISITSTAPGIPNVSGVTTLCAGGNTVLSITSPTPTATYEWTYNGITTVGNTFNVNAVANSTSVSVVEKLNTCTSTPRVVPITVQSIPVAPAVTSPTICFGQTATLNAVIGAGGSAPVVWYSDAAATNAIVTSNTYTTPALTANTTYYARSNGGLCPSLIASAVVTVNALPLVTISNPAGNICSGNSTILTASGAQQYEWYIAGTTTVIATGPNFTVNPTSATTYSVVGSSIQNNVTCPASPVNTTLGVTSPLAPAVSGATTVCSGESTLLTITSPNPSANYEWTYNGVATIGNTYNVTNVTAQGSVSVIEKIGDCSSTPTIVSINLYAPIAGPAVTTPVICSGLSANLVATPSVSGAPPIVWYSDPAATAVLATNTVGPFTFQTPPLTQTTSYYVRALGGVCKSEISIATVTVNPLPTMPTSNTPLDVCLNSNANLIASSIGNNVTYAWYANSSPTGSPISNTAVYTATGLNTLGVRNYYVKATSSDGCDSPLATVTITVVALPPAPIVPGPSICAGTSATLSPTNLSSNYSYHWFSDPAGVNEIFAGVSNSTLTTGNLLANATYYIRSNDNLCQSPLSAITVQVNALPPAPTAPSVTICQGTTATLNSSTSGGGTAIEWFSDPGGLNNLNGTNTSLASYTTPILNSNTSYWVAQRNTANCRSALTLVDVVVNPTPVTPTVAGVTICQGQAATLNALNVTGTVQWYANASATVPLSGSGNPSYTTGNLNNTTSYYIRQFSAANCPSALTAATVTVNPTPLSPSLSSSTPTSICEGNSVDLSAITGGGNGTYTWFSDPLLLNALSSANPYTTPVLNNNTTYYLTETVNGCRSNSSPIAITVNPTPTVPTITTPQTTICEGSFAVLTLNGASGAVEWFSDGTATNVIGTASTYTTPALTNSQTYWAHQTSLAGCRSALGSINITVQPNPLAPTAFGTTICAGATAVLTAAGAPAGNYQWYSVANPSPSATTLNATNTPSISVSPVVSTQYFVRVLYNNCNSPMTIVPVTVTPKPFTPDIVASATSICAGDQVTLSAVTGTNGTSSNNGTFAWYSATNTLLSSANPYILTNVTTNFTYRLRETANGCLSDFDSISITVSPRPLTPATSTVSACEGSAPILTVLPANPLNGIRWFAFPNAQSTQLSTSNSFTAPPLYSNVTYWVQEFNTTTGCGSDLAPYNVNINPVPTLPTVTGATICSGASVNLTAYGSPGNTMAWYSTITSSTPLSVASTYTTPVLTSTTQYWVEQVSNSNCRSSRVPVTVTVLPVPALPTVSASNDSLCVGESVTISAAQIPNAVYQWQGPNGSTYGGQSIYIPSVALNNSGTYTLNVTVNGCSATGATAHIVVSPLPSITGNIIVNDATLCEGATLTLSANASAGANYEWTLANGTTSTSAVVTINNVREADDQGFYNLQLTSPAGCLSPVYATLVNVYSVPSILISENTSPKCAQELISFTATAYSGAHYAWYYRLPDGTADTISTTRAWDIASADTTQNRYYYLAVTTAQGCPFSHVDSTEVIVYGLPDANAGLDQTILEDTVAQLEATGGIIYQWSAPNGGLLNDYDIPNPVTLPLAPDSYVYNVTVTDAHFCRSVDNVTVTVQPRIEQEIYNSFSPNNDGVNDVWTIPFINNLQNYTLQVFDRYGYEVFRSVDYLGNEWDGTSKGKQLPAGAYWYVLRTEDKTYKGAVTIFR